MELLGNKHWMLVQNIGGIVMLDENIGVGYWGICYNICS